MDLPVLTRALDVTPFWFSRYWNRIYDALLERVKGSAEIRQYLECLKLGGFLSHKLLSLVQFDGSSSPGREEPISKLCRHLALTTQEFKGYVYTLDPLLDCYHPFTCDPRYGRINQVLVVDTFPTHNKPLLLSLLCDDIVPETPTTTPSPPPPLISSKKTMNLALPVRESPQKRRALTPTASSGSSLWSGSENPSSASSTSETSTASAAVTTTTGDRGTFSGVGKQAEILGKQSVLYPMVIFKRGDDLRQDMCCMHVFRLMNYLWWRDKLDFGAKQVPVQFLVYGCIAAGDKAGFIEYVPRCIPLKDVKKLTPLSPDDRDRLIATSAGSYIGCYVLGIRDRHHDNVLVKPDAAVFHIDFGHVFGEKVTVDTGNFAITPALKRAMGEDWNAFVETSVKAFATLRQQRDILLSFVSMMFSSLGISSQTAEQFLNRTLMLEKEIGRAVQQECRDRSRMPSSA
eukprot:TRINITY_DN4611_c0_g3_i2.p1 TRINITY_DN4611_c0_g3~~TRINITY_DN4611_c0_g3_i2.p1  ORF type:complete len:467 (-),score=33.76 TRINITY_DN4611_c0_g3_i2:17-1393(-)